MRQLAEALRGDWATCEMPQAGTGHGLGSFPEARPSISANSPRTSRPPTSCPMTGSPAPTTSTTTPVKQAATDFELSGDFASLTQPMVANVWGNPHFGRRMAGTAGFTVPHFVPSPARRTPPHRRSARAAHRASVAEIPTPASARCAGEGALPSVAGAQNWRLRHSQAA